MLFQSQDIETATTVLESQPDSKTRRYDRQLRLWAASGQRALENSRVLLLSGSATSASILKNLVLPGIGHFTILDDSLVTPRDAGNNFFLEGDSSIGKPRAEEVVRLLLELNDQVEGKADLRNVKNVVEEDPEYIKSFTLVIAHNLDLELLRKLSNLLWGSETDPALMVVSSAGFMAEFSIQFYEHCVMESHSDAVPSLRMDKPFSSLLEYTDGLDFQSMDPTDHSHLPYVVILVRALQTWKQSHDGSPPKSYAEKQEFKQHVLDMRLKLDEENFEEAEAQAYRCAIATTVPSEISSLFSHPALSAPLTPTSPPFFLLLAALKKFTEQPPHVLPLTSTLPDMRADTKNYIHLQKLYKKQADDEKTAFKGYLKEVLGGEEGVVEDAMVDTFVKNVHQLKILKGKKWGALDKEKTLLAQELSNAPNHASTHLAMSALLHYHAQSPDTDPTLEQLRTVAHSLVGQDVQLPEEFDVVAGEIARTPTAELPNTAAFLGGMVAQEAIKMITKQYVPITGYCVIDLVETSTAIVG